MPANVELHAGFTQSGDILPWIGCNVQRILRNPAHSRESLATYGTAGYATFHKLARAYMPRRQLRAQTYPHRHTLGGGPRMTMRYVEALSRRGFEESGTARLIVLTRTPQYKRGSRVP